MSRYVRTHQVRELMRLTAEVRRSPGPARVQAVRLLHGLARIVEAMAGSSLTDLSFCATGGSALSDVVSFGWPERRPSKFLRAKGTAAHPLVAAMVLELPSATGATASALREAVVIDRDWYESDFVRHGLVSTQPLDSSLLSLVRLDGTQTAHAISLYRASSAPRFDEADLQLVQLFHEECLPYITELDRQPSFSAREQQTLELLQRGLSDKEIAEALGISRHTVNQYTKAIYQKTAVHGRAELLARLAGTR